MNVFHPASFPQTELYSSSAILERIYVCLNSSYLKNVNLNVFPDPSLLLLFYYFVSGWQKYNFFFQSATIFLFIKKIIHPSPSLRQLSKQSTQKTGGQR
jgi:hypothetical protein